MLGLCFIFVLLVVALAYAPTGQPQYLSPTQTLTGQTPLEVLKARYARGEIAAEEYDQVRRDLEG